MPDIDEVTSTIIREAIRIHRALGPGLLESVYLSVLARALTARQLDVQRQASLPFTFDGMRFEHGLRVDLLVERALIVELKSVEKLQPVHFKQVLTYLRLSERQVGLLINFGAPLLRDGLHRIVNHFDASGSTRLRVNAS